MPKRYVEVDGSEGYALIKLAEEWQAESEREKDRIALIMTESGWATVFTQTERQIIAAVQDTGEEQVQWGVMYFSALSEMYVRSGTVEDYSEAEAAINAAIADIVKA